MRNDPPPEWVRQLRLENELLTAQVREITTKYNKLCEEVVKNRIDIAVLWTKVAWIAIGISVGVKLLPAIIKVLQSAPK